LKASLTISALESIVESVGAADAHCKYIAATQDNPRAIRLTEYIFLIEIKEETKERKVYIYNGSIMNQLTMYARTHTLIGI
jgi:hypothetical protein